MTPTNGSDTEIYDTADAAFQDCRDRNEHAQDYRTGSCCLRAAVDAAIGTAAAERWINKQLDETGLKSMDFRNGMTMDIEPAREMVAAWVGAARAMLGDAPNYSETPIEMVVKVAEDPERFAFTLQRVGKLTPHQARQQAEDAAAKLHSTAARALAALEDLIADSRDPGVEALGARYELADATGALSPYERPLDEPGFSPAADLAAVLRIVSDTVIEANDSGGIDLNDLVTRLEQAGYPLPDDDADMTAAAGPMSGQATETRNP